MKDATNFNLPLAIHFHWEPKRKLEADEEHGIESFIKQHLQDAFKTVESFKLDLCSRGSPLVSERKLSSSELSLSLALSRAHRCTTIELLKLQNHLGQLGDAIKLQIVQCVRGMSNS
ncbi:hypothetical protein DY000_02035068 [Brassica cretica]|uniref:Uncharacterized protein n=1 Tax=Brassica cretica TaxID=69181 RepID=A0ABQ7DUW3_BRACR|nr:hypothetical protein DY000_02035068 [Brassica cretica]